MPPFQCSDLVSRVKLDGSSCGILSKSCKGVVSVLKADGRGIEMTYEMGQ